MRNPDPEFWLDRRVLVTGHTGFKGAWLIQWLSSLGARVFGLSIGALPGQSLYASLKDAGKDIGLEGEYAVDIRDQIATAKAIHDCKPDVILHLAAQSLVRPSYHEPVETLATNVMGTAHVLDALRGQDFCEAVVCVTSDKCYRNREWIWAYREDEALGGHDPYSASKAAAELVISSYRDSFFNEGQMQLASARAGNVIGGGDWAEDRLIPDCIRSFEKAQSVEIRNPAATRPWQHVLEPLCGYLLLAESLVAQTGHYNDSWNFGPRFEDVKPVETLVGEMIGLWGEEANWHLAEGAQPHEAMALNVDATKARQRLGWQPRLSIEQGLSWTVDWHKRKNSGECENTLCRDQIELYTQAQVKG